MSEDELDDYTKMYFTLKGEILALKLLLKECRDFIELVNIIDGGKSKLLTKIDNAIGEKNNV